MSSEIIAALIGMASITVAGQVMLWLRFEHRMTVLEERLKLREMLEDERFRINNGRIGTSTA